MDEMDEHHLVRLALDEVDDEHEAMAEYYFWHTKLTLLSVLELLLDEHEEHEVLDDEHE
jgi:hypothetical protein